jgi:hypothetical protein
MNNQIIYRPLIVGGMPVETLHGIEPRVWDLATDRALQEVALALSQLPPYIPPTPEIRLQAAIFNKKLVDYRAPLVEIFLRLHHPEGEWEDYLEWCCAWVIGMLEDSIRFETNLLTEPLHQQLETITERLKTILFVRFGFDSRGAKTLEQTGREFNLTKERISQLQEKALHMLRHPSRSQYLRHVLLGERLRTRLFAEFNNASAYPAMFLLWKEDREILLSLRKSLEQVTKNNGRTKSVNFHNSDNAGTLYDVQQNFSFRD